MSGGPTFYSPSASFVYGLSAKMRVVSNWIERQYRARKGIDESDPSNVVARPVRVQSSYSNTGQRII